MTRRSVLTRSLYALTLAAVLTIALASLTRFDFWWYLKSGETILQTRSVPATDPFSYTAQGRPWINHMWATQVLLVVVWRIWGRIALILLKGAVVTATFAVVMLTMRRRGVHPVLAAAVTLLAARTGWEYWDVRPQIVTYLLVAVYLWLLRDGWDTRGRLLWLMPLLMLAWANLHAGFVTGFALITLIGVGTALPRLMDEARRADGWRATRRAAMLMGLALLASLVNPYGARAILFPLEVAKTSAFTSSTLEWFSPNFHDPSYRGLEAMLLLLFPAIAWGRARLSTTDALLLFTFAHLALLSTRHVPIFAVVVAPPLAEALQQALGRVGAARSRVPSALSRLRAALPSLWPLVASPAAPAAAAVVALSIGLVAYWGAFLHAPGNPIRADLNERRYPERTMTFIKRERLPAPLFNLYAWGGYELWRLYPEYQVFIDGRTHVYGPEVLDDFLQVANLGPRWQAVLDRWRVQTVLAPRRSLLTEALLAVGGWRLVFAEREAVVFVREGEENRELLARLGAVSLGEAGGAMAGRAPGAAVAAGVARRRSG